MGDLLDTDRRFKLLFAATEEQLAQIDAILSKTPQPKDSQPTDLRSCTQQEAARRLGMSYSTIHRMMRRGVLKSVIVNKNPRILLSSVYEVGLSYATPSKARK